MKKRGRISLLSAVFLLMFLTCAFTTPAAAKTNYKKIYGKLLKRSTLTCKDVYGDKLTFTPNAFILINLDRKGPKELIITDEYRVQWHIYTIKRKKAKHIFSRGWMGSDGDGIYYNKKKKGLVRAWSDGTGLMHNCLFCFKNGKKGSDIHLYRSWIYGTYPSKFYYQVNGKGATKERYLNYFHKYFDYKKKGGNVVYKGTKFYRYVDNTAANRAKKLK